MLTHCLVCKKNTENDMIKTKSGRLMLLSKCSKCGDKK